MVRTKNSAQHVGQVSGRVTDHASMFCAHPLRTTNCAGALPSPEQPADGSVSTAGGTQRTERKPPSPGPGRSAPSIASNARSASNPEKDGLADTDPSSVVEETDGPPPVWGSAVPTQWSWKQIIAG